VPNKVYVRPIIEHNSVVWSPSALHDIDAIERVQKRFTKRLSGFRNCSYEVRSKRLNLQSLELRRLLSDLIWCYKIVFGLVDMNSHDFFMQNTVNITRGHGYKLFKRSTSGVRSFSSVKKSSTPGKSYQTMYVSTPLMDLKEVCQMLISLLKLLNATKSKLCVHFVCFWLFPLNGACMYCYFFSYKLFIILCCIVYLYIV